MRRRWACIVAAGVASAVVMLAEGRARASPQIGAAVRTGAAMTDLRTSSRPGLAYHLAGQVDLLLLRDRAGLMALGPYVEVATTGFESLETGGGIEWLVPAGETAFIFSGGPFGRLARAGWEPGLAGTVFWGSRSYNYHSAYSLSAGLVLQGRFGLGDSRQADVILGVELDLELLALPFLLAYGAIAY